MLLDRVSRRVNIGSQRSARTSACGHILVVNDTTVPRQSEGCQAAQRRSGRGAVPRARPIPARGGAASAARGSRPGVRRSGRDGLGLEISEDLGGARRRLVFDEAAEASPPGHRRGSGAALYPECSRRSERLSDDLRPDDRLSRCPHGRHALHRFSPYKATACRHRNRHGHAPHWSGHLRSVEEAQAEDHLIHSEWCQVTPEAVAGIEHARSEGGRVVAVGTTAVRVLESAASRALAGQGLAAFEGTTDLFILPGHTFRAVDALITNFHLPRSTLLMLVSAFAGREPILAAYQGAIEGGYRFYSYGDAMLIV